MDTGRGSKYNNSRFVIDEGAPWTGIASLGGQELSVFQGRQVLILCVNGWRVNRVVPSPCLQSDL